MWKKKPENEYGKTTRNYTGCHFHVTRVCHALFVVYKSFIHASNERILFMKKRNSKLYESSKIYFRIFLIQNILSSGKTKKNHFVKHSTNRILNNRLYSTFRCCLVTWQSDKAVMFSIHLIARNIRSYIYYALTAYNPVTWFIVGPIDILIGITNF